MHEAGNLITLMNEHPSLIAGSAFILGNIGFPNAVSQVIEISYP